MILVDTSVWVDHLRSGDAALVGALEAGDVCTHAFVIGELACGRLRNRAEVLGLLERLPRKVSILVGGEKQRSTLAGATPAKVQAAIDGIVDEQTMLHRLRYVWLMSLLVFLQTPIAGALTTYYIGQAVFEQRPPWRDSIQAVLPTGRPRSAR